MLHVLVENALQHGASELTLWTEEQGAAVQLHLQDNGSGISPSNRAKIFDAFFTTERESGGTGLGLTIANALLKQTRGRLELVSENGPTTFRITLPATG